MKKILLTLLAAVVLAACGGKKLTLNDYVIVIPENATTVEQTAATAMQKYLKEISGTELQIANDAAAPAEKEILIGATNRMALDSLDALADDGFIIKTDGDKLAIYGGKKKGTLYGVYGFLEDYLGCRMYTKDAIVVPKSANIEIPAVIYDKQVPVYTSRYAHYRGTNDSLYVDWHKISNDKTGEKPEWGPLWVHTFFALVPPAEYFKTHPEYYALRSGKRAMTQLCLSNPEVLEIVCKNLKTAMDKKPEATHWSVSQDDNQSYCQCENCAKLDAVDGGPMGSMLTFVNKVAERFPDKVISTLAYLYSRQAPTTTKPLPNVNIMFCNIESNRSQPIATDPLEAGFRKDMEDWAKLTNNIYMWDYVVQFSNLVSPFPNIHLLQPNMQYFVANNVKEMFPQGNREIGGEFAALRAYMIAKLLWNPDLDYNATLNDFCNGYYGAAGPYVREYIDLMAKNLNDSGDKMHIFGNPTAAANSWLSAENMAKYNAIFDKAEAAVASEPEFAKRVKYARQPLVYVEIEMPKLDPFGPNGVFEQKDGLWAAKPAYVQKVKDFVAACNEEGVTRIYEWYITPDEYLENALACTKVHVDGNLAYGKTAKVNVPLSGYDGQGKGLPILTDGVFGGTDFAVQWLGFELPAFEVDVDLESVQNVSSVTSRYLQCLKDWLFHPAKVEVLVSEDGKSYTKMGEVTNEADPKVAVGGKEFAVKFPATKAQYVKVKVTAVGICPVWHGGAGSPTWTFIDEVVVE